MSQSGNKPLINFSVGALTLMVTCTPLIGYAEPAIRSVEVDTSLTSNGSLTMTILGSGFGSGPNVVMYEDFSRAQKSTDTSLNSMPIQGKWFEATGESYVINKGSVSIQDNALVIRDSVNQPARASLVLGIEDKDGVHGLRHFQEVYLSYSVKDFGEFPGRGGTLDSFSDISSSKNAWLMFGHRGDNTAYAMTLGQPAGHDLVVSTWTGGGFAAGGNNTKLSPTVWHNELTKNWAFQDWNTINFHGALNPDDPYGNAEGFFEFVNKNIYSHNRRYGNLMSDQTEEGVPYPFWDRIKFFSWDRYDESDVIRATDNIYVAIGENANARVVLTDNELLQNSKVMVHLLPLTWTNDTIKAYIPPEARSADYLHIINSDNNTSKAYYICQSCPTPPVLITE